MVQKDAIHPASRSADAHPYDLPAIGPGIVALADDAYTELLGECSCQPFKLALELVPSHKCLSFLAMRMKKDHARRHREGAGWPNVFRWVAALLPASPDLLPVACLAPGCTVWM